MEPNPHQPRNFYFRITVVCGLLFFVLVLLSSPSGTTVRRAELDPASDVVDGSAAGRVVVRDDPESDDDGSDAPVTAATKRRRRRRQSTEAAEAAAIPTEAPIMTQPPNIIAPPPVEATTAAAAEATSKGGNCGMQQDPRTHISAAPLPPWVLADPYRIRTPADGDVFMTPNARSHHEKYFASVIIYPPNEVRDMVARSGMFEWLRRPSDTDLLRPQYRGDACWTRSADSQLDGEAVNNRRLWQHGAQSAFTPPDVVNEPMRSPDGGIHLVPVVLIMNPVGVSNFEADFAVYELIPPGGVVVAIFTTDNVLNPHDAQLETMREYFRIPGVARVYNPWTYFTDSEDPSCAKIRRVAEFIQPHYVYGVGDERGVNVCPGRTYLQSYADPKRKLEVFEGFKRFADGVRGTSDGRWSEALTGGAGGQAVPKMIDAARADREQAVGANEHQLVPMYHIRPALLRMPELWQTQIALAQPDTTYFVPTVTVHYKTHGARGVHHCPFFHSGDTFPRPMRRRGESISGLTFNGWPLPQGRPELTARDGSPAREYSYEAKAVPGEVAFDAAAGVLRAARQFESAEAEWREATQRANQDPAHIADNFWKFPPRNVWPFEVAPFERPRRYAWALMGQTHYGTRDQAIAAFRQIFGQLPHRVNGGSNLDRTLRQDLSRWEVMQQVLSDSVFAPVGGGTMTFETARPYDAARCGAIPVVVSHQQDLDITYLNLLGFEGQYPDGWIVGHSWEDAARLAKQALETPGEVQRLRRLVLHGYERMRNALHAHVRRGMDFARTQEHQSLWDEAYGEFALGTPNP